MKLTYLKIQAILELIDRRLSELDKGIDTKERTVYSIQKEEEGMYKSPETQQRELLESLRQDFISVISLMELEITPKLNSPLVKYNLNAQPKEEK